MNEFVRVGATTPKRVLKELRRGYHVTTICDSQIFAYVHVIISAIFYC